VRAPCAPVTGSAVGLAGASEPLLGSGLPTRSAGAREFGATGASAHGIAESAAETRTWPWGVRRNITPGTGRPQPYVELAGDIACTSAAPLLSSSIGLRSLCQAPAQGPALAKKVHAAGAEKPPHELVRDHHVGHLATLSAGSPRPRRARPVSRCRSADLPLGWGRRPPARRRRSPPSSVRAGRARGRTASRGRGLRSPVGSLGVVGSDLRTVPGARTRFRGRFGSACTTGAGRRAGLRGRGGGCAALVAYQGDATLPQVVAHLRVVGFGDLAGLEVVVQIADVGIQGIARAEVSATYWIEKSHSAKAAARLPIATLTSVATA